MSREVISRSLFADSLYESVDFFIEFLLTASSITSFDGNQSACLVCEAAGGQLFAMRRIRTLLPRDLFYLDSRDGPSTQ